MLANDLLLEARAQSVKNIAAQLGFHGCGISKAAFLEEEAPRLEKWLSRGMHGNMSYMERNFDKRLDPSKLVEGTRSVISLTYNYYTGTKLKAGAPKVSKYAFGEDYHFVIKDKLKEFMHRLLEVFGEVGGRVFVDSAPVMDKVWAKKSGLGWAGKNANLINKGNGSFFFIAELLVDIDLWPDGPVKDHCGTCRKCIDACPTGAIEQPYVVNGSKCISYFTIELREEMFPGEIKGQFENWMFGCDICQDVCPWNRFGKQHEEPRFSPPEALVTMGKKEWLELEEEAFQALFRKSPLKRSGYNGIKRNLRFLYQD